MDDLAALEEDRKLPRAWKLWAAVSLLNGTPLVDVLAALRDGDADGDEAVRYCASLYDNIAFEAGQWPAMQLRKLHSVLGMLEQMRSLASTETVIDRRSGVGRDEFLNRYYSQNTPVILTDVCDRWPARFRWNEAYLVDRLGQIDVQVMIGRDADADYEINADEHKSRMPFDQYVDWVNSTDRSNDAYLVANNGLLSTDAGAVLWNDFDLDERYLEPDPDRSHAFLWYGPAGTVTPLHHDNCNVLFSQVIGSKHFILIPALEIHRMYNEVAVYSDVDPLDPDLDEFPLFADAQQLHVDVGPGDTLFIPAGWWHHVQSLEPSISISFTNFAFPNSISWNDPSRVL